VAPPSYADPDTNLCAGGDQHNHTNMDANGVSHHHDDCHRNGGANGDACIALTNSDSHSDAGSTHVNTFADRYAYPAGAHVNAGSFNRDACPAYAYAIQATQTQLELSP